MKTSPDTKDMIMDIVDIYPGIKKIDIINKVKEQYKDFDRHYPADGQTSIENLVQNNKIVELNFYVNGYNQYIYFPFVTVFKFKR